MSYLLKQKNKMFVFIHIPKTGGTTIEKICKNTENIKFKKINYTDDDHLYNGHLPARPLARRYSILHHNYFSIVRNPWDWYVSWFSYLDQKNRSDKDFQHEIELIQEGFPSFLEFISNNKDNLVFENGCKKYAQFVDWCSTGDKIIDNVFRLEDLKENPFLIRDKIGLDIVFNKQYNTSNHAPYPEYYDKKAIDIVYNMHKEDIKTFNFEFGK
jgi:chondroitin 4-sulfotransferase 11